MMTIESIYVWTELWMFVLSLAGVMYGGFYFFFRKKARYPRMITLGVGCQMLARLLDLAAVWIFGKHAGGIHVGILGIIGSLMFLLNANYGQMDSLVDDGSKAFIETRLKAVFAPIALALIYGLFFQRVEDVRVRVVTGVLLLVMLPCAYYNCKHVIIYDVEGGIIRRLRTYNMMALAYCLFILLENVSYYLEMAGFYLASCLILGLISAGLLPVLKNGMEKWTAVI